MAPAKGKKATTRSSSTKGATEATTKAGASRKLKEKKAKQAGRPKKQAEKQAASEPLAESSGDDEDEEPEVSAKAEKDPNAFSITWDVELTLRIVAAIYESQDIKQGLFPGCGGNVSSARGGGQPKTTWLWALCKQLFTDHTRYGEAFQRALDQSAAGKTQLQAKWVERLKNRLKAMGDNVTRISQEMGQTGQGLSSADEIDPDSEIASKWDVIKIDCPWYFDMKALIGDRPSKKPVGLGNSQDGIDITVLQDEASSGVEDSVPINDADTSSDPPFSMDQPDDETDVETKPATSLKKRKPDTPEDVKPSVPKLKAAKKSKISEFAEVAAAEEVTEQKRLDLEKAKLDAQIKIKINADRNKTARLQAKLDARSKYKLEKYRLKLQAEAAAQAAVANGGMGGMGMGAGMFSNTGGVGGMIGEMAAPFGDAMQYEMLPPYPNDLNA